MDFESKKLFFSLLNLTILNNCVIFATSGAKLSHRLFILTLGGGGDLIQDVGKMP